MMTADEFHRDEPGDAAALAACQAEIFEALKRHGCAGVFTIQRPTHYATGTRLVAPHTLISEKPDGTISFDLATLTAELGVARFVERLALSLSAISALRDGSRKNASDLGETLASIEQYLRGAGIGSRNLGPMGKKGGPLQ